MKPPLGSATDRAQYHVTEQAEFVVVGSGAAGATFARWLTAAGRSVVVVEEGGAAKPAGGEGLTALNNLYRDAGTTTAAGADALLILQGRAVGGSTFVAGAIHAPLPEATWRIWAERDRVWKTRIPWEQLEAARQRIDLELAVQKTPRALLSDDAEALTKAMPGEAMPTWRGTPACVGSGRCLVGCPNAGKASANLTLLPFAIQKGARLHSRCRVEGIDFQGSRAVGVHGHFDNGYRFTASATVAVIVAAGAVETPRLLLRSGVRAVGEGWSCHPTATVAGLWHKPIAASGATFGVDLQLTEAEGLNVDTVRLPEAWRRLTLPGYGPALAERLEQLDQVATWQLRLRPDAVGRVRLSGLGRLARVEFSLTEADRQRLAQGIAATCGALLRSGALEVWPGVRGWPSEVTALRQVHELATRPIAPGAVHLAAGHLFGGVATDTRGQVIGTERLIVADASALPGPSGVPPLSLLHAMATVIADRWADAKA